MPRFHYVAKDAKGKTMKGEFPAADKDTLVEILKNKGLTTISTREIKQGKAGGGGAFGKKKVPLSDVVVFSRQMATMIEAGIPILQALEIVAEQTDHKTFKEVLKDVAKRVSAGTSIHKAMSFHIKVFGEFFVHLVRAGEESGNLDEILDRISGYLEKSDKLRRKVKSAMVYPAVVLSMAVAITVLMLVKVIPVFVEMYAGFNVALPAPTQFLINLSDFVSHNLLFIAGGCVLAVVMLKRYQATEKGGLAVDRFKLRVPIFGSLIRKISVSRFARTLGTLLRSGVPILRAIDIVAKTSGNKLIEKVVNDSGRFIREGRKISEPLQESKVFPPMVTRMIAVGETSGELDKMLGKIADFYDDQVDTAVAGLTSMIEPVVIAFLGIVVGGILICMFLPMFKMVTAISA